MTKIVSIITAVRNDLNGLKNTYASIKASLNKNIEWIVIDGNSIDGTQVYLKNLNCDFLRWVSEKDNNMYEAMNKGIKLAEGNYLQFLNAGDILNVNLNDLFFQNEIEDIIYFNITKKGVDNKIIKWTLPKNFLDELNKYASVPHQSTFIKKSVFIKYGYYSLNYKYLGDYEFFCRIYQDIKNRPSHKFYLDKYIVSFICNGVTFNYRLSLRLMNESVKIQKLYFGMSHLPTKILYIIKYVSSFLPGHLKMFNFLRKIYYI